DRMSAASRRGECRYTLTGVVALSAGDRVAVAKAPGIIDEVQRLGCNLVPTDLAERGGDFPRCSRQIGDQRKFSAVTNDGGSLFGSLESADRAFQLDPLDLRPSLVILLDGRGDRGIGGNVDAVAALRRRQEIQVEVIVHIKYRGRPQPRGAACRQGRDVVRLQIIQYPPVQLGVCRVHRSVPPFLAVAMPLVCGIRRNLPTAVLERRLRKFSGVK